MLDKQLNPDSKNTKWCLGIPCTGSRPLSSTEITFLKRQLGNIRAMWISLTITSFAVPVLTFTLFYFTSKVWSDSFGNFFAIISIIALLICFPFLFVLANDYFKDAKNLKKDVEAGLVYSFEGEPEKPGEEERLLSKIPMGENKKLTFEILPAGFIFSVNGSLVRTRGNSR